MRIDGSGNVSIGVGASPGGVARLESQRAARTTAFNAADGATWHDLLVRNPTNSENAASGIAFVMNNTYHANAGSGIAAIAGAGSDYSSALAFITRPHGAVAVERMRIHRDGGLGIGTTAPGTYKLYVNGITKSGSSYPLTDNAHELGNTSLRWASLTAVAVTGVTGTFSGAVSAGGNLTIPQGNLLYLDGGSNTYIYSDTADSIAFATNSGVRLTLSNTLATFSGSVICESSLTVDSSLTGTTASFSGDGYFGGSLAVNTASVGSYKLYVTGNTKCAGFMIATNVQSQGAAFFDSNIRLKATATPTGASYEGRLYAYNNTGVMLYYKDGYNTAHALHSASDYRLKENITDYSGSDACALVKGVNAKRFDYITGSTPSDQQNNRVGFMAHELQDAGCDFGGVVSGVKDETMDDGEGNQIPRMQSVDYKAMVPILWSALQEALKRIEVLEEGNN